MGHRKIASELRKDRLEKSLENKRNIRKSNTAPMECTVQLKLVRRMSQENIETICDNREKMGDSLPEGVPKEVLYSYLSHPDFYSAII